MFSGCFPGFFVVGIFEVSKNRFKLRLHPIDISVPCFWPISNREEPKRKTNFLPIQVGSFGFNSNPFKKEINALCRTKSVLFFLIFGAVFRLDISQSITNIVLNTTM